MRAESYPRLGRPDAAGSGVFGIGSAGNADPVAPLDAGRYRVTIEVDDMSVARTANETVAVAGLPSYLSYESTQAVILRDGQSVEYATATDPTNGMS